MIILLTGKNGAGKTYNASVMLYDYWLKGIDVYTNSPMFFLPSKVIDKQGWQILDKHNPDTWPELFSWFERMKFKFLVTKPYKLPWRWFKLPMRGRIKYFEELDETYMITDAVIFYDEGQELFDAQYWESLPKFFKRKLRQHRKDFLDIITTTQEAGQIDKNYRRLIQLWYDYERISKIGSDPRLILARFRSKMMDCMKLKSDVDITMIPVLQERYFWVHWFSKRLYDPMWHVNFHYFRIIWIKRNNYKTNKLEEVAITCPKDMSIKVALQTLSSMKSQVMSKILSQ